MSVIRLSTPAAGDFGAQFGPDVERSVPVLDGARRASIAFISATPELFEEYLTYLRADGYAVSLTAGVGEAAAQARAHCPDLMFLDLGESSLTGLTMLRDLKADGCLGAIPLVMVGSFDSLDDIQAGLELGACDYIIKTETTAFALARRVPAWARVDNLLKAGLQRSTGKSSGAPVSWRPGPNLGVPPRGREPVS